MPVPVITVAQMREWEQATWATGESEDAVMRRAGQAVARCAERLTQPGDHILVLAGKGHNGDDAAYAAEYLRGRAGDVLRIADPEAALSELVLRLEQRPALIIDGLFGIGLNRPLSTPWLKLIERLNQSGARALALDVPSGLNADTGLPMDQAVRAHTTLTLGAVKAGLLRNTAWPFVGRLEVAPEIGLARRSVDSKVVFLQPSDFVDYPPPRPIAGHKGTFGHLAIVAGSRGYHGAAVLAALGAQRAQPGLITLCVPGDVYVPVASQLQSVMVRSFADEPALPENCTAVLAGPGLAAPDLPGSLKDWVRRLWTEFPVPMVVDASAQDWLPPGEVKSHALRIITPHPGEAARLLGTSAAQVLADRWAALRTLSDRHGRCHVVLKGHQTVIGSCRAKQMVNCSGNPHLGQGGSGDVLAGYIAGFLAQPFLAAGAEDAVSFAVWQHGAAADHLQASKPGWSVADLAAMLGSIRPAPGGDGLPF